MKAIFVALQDKNSRRWAPVARVSKEGGLYKLYYTQGAKIIGFSGFGRMSDLTQEYLSEELFPILKNRALPKSRPEYGDYLSWLGLSDKEHDELDELSRSGGLRATDEIELIPVPLKTKDNLYEAFFFVRGIRHLPPEAEFRIKELLPGDRLFVLKDIQNVQDGSALLLRTDDPISLVGYAPRYYSRDFNELVQEDRHKNVTVSIEQVNYGAPAAYRLLCKITAPWPDFFEICSASSFMPIKEEGPESTAKT